MEGMLEKYPAGGCVHQSRALRGHPWCFRVLVALQECGTSWQRALFPNICSPWCPRRCYGDTGTIARQGQDS